jgi:TusA-related sulfurtransferase
VNDPGPDIPVGVLDARGLLCPAPVIALARRVTEVAIGDEVEVWADDPAARHDIPAWCRMTGQVLVESSTVGLATSPGHRFVVRRET